MPAPSSAGMNAYIPHESWHWPCDWLDHVNISAELQIRMSPCPGTVLLRGKPTHESALGVTDEDSGKTSYPPGAWFSFFTPGVIIAASQELSNRRVLKACLVQLDTLFTAYCDQSFIQKWSSQCVCWDTALPYFLCHEAFSVDWVDPSIRSQVLIFKTSTPL